MKRIMLVLVLMGLEPTTTAADDAVRAPRESDPGRGLWFWGKPASADGAVSIVGNEEREAEALATFARWRVRRLYGSYAEVPSERPAAMAAWNRKLHAAGLRSEFLFSDNAAIAGNGRARLIQLADERVLRFNRSRRDAAERFDGIALDIEPHATAQWKTAGPEQRRALLEEFLATCTALRAYLDEHDAKALTISAALAYWLDGLPPKNPGWRSASERDDWFARLGRSVATISLMAYERSRPEAILDATAWEREHFSGRTITALRARMGVEWKTLADLQRVLPAVETEAGGVDLENYELLRAAERAAAATARQ